jgi:hypothetical protein
MKVKETDIIDRRIARLRAALRRLRLERRLAVLREREKRLGATIRP